MSKILSPFDTAGRPTESVFANESAQEHHQANLLDHALRYAAMGWRVFPLAGKKPITRNGSLDATGDIDTIREWWLRYPDANIGFAPGDQYWVMDVDPRHGGDQSIESLTVEHGPLPDTLQQDTGGGGKHYVFRLLPGQDIQCSQGRIAVGVDVKTGNGYVVVAPSIHPETGRPYVWDGIAEFDAQLILPAPQWLVDRAIGVPHQTLVAQKIPNFEKVAKGGRHKHLVSHAGSMRRRRMSQAAIDAALQVENLERCDPPKSEAEVRQIAASVALYHPAGATDTVGPTDWPKLVPIEGDLPPVEAFSADLLPLSFRALMQDVTERMQVPMDYPAITIVLCLAGAVNRRAVIQPKAEDTGWVIVPNLWGGIVAAPGMMKSPVIQAATRPLKEIQTEWRREYETALEDFSRQSEECEIRRAAWKDQFKASVKKGTAAPDRPEAGPQEPKARRLIINDASSEALHQTMSENPAGVLAIRDELTGWWSQLDKPGREGERAFCLQAWNGDTSHTVDRIGRGTIHVEACCMSMLGGIQPGRLRSYLVDALKDGPSNDGLIQRFQLLVWPDTPRGWKYVDRAPDAASEQQAERVFRKLVDLDTGDPALFRFAPDAQELFTEWLADLEARVRGDELHPALISHLSKYRSLMPSLALLFELADRAGSVGFEGSHLARTQNFVSLEHTQLAALWCDYLDSHARRVYSCVTTPQLRAARELASKIRQRKVGADGFFSCRSVYLNGWSGLESPEAVKQAAEILQDAGWLREPPDEWRPLGGRPSTRYEVNPKARA